MDEWDMARTLAREEAERDQTRAMWWKILDWRILYELFARYLADGVVEFRYRGEVRQFDAKGDDPGGAVLAWMKEVDG